VHLRALRRLERWIEGPGNRRIRRHLGPWTFDKTWRKAVKHTLFLSAALFFTHVFLTFFAVRSSDRTSFEANSLRSARLPFTLVDDGIRNLYTLEIQNRTGEERVHSPTPAESTVTAFPDLRFIIPQASVTLPTRLPVDLDRSAAGGQRGDSGDRRAPQTRAAPLERQPREVPVNHE